MNWRSVFRKKGMHLVEIFLALIKIQCELFGKEKSKAAIKNDNNHGYSMEMMFSLQ